MFNKSGSQFFYCHRKGSLAVVDVESMAVVASASLSGSATVKCLVLSRSGRRLLANCSDKRIRMIDARKLIV